MKSILIVLTFISSLFVTQVSFAQTPKKTGPVTNLVPIPVDPVCDGCVGGGGGGGAPIYYGALVAGGADASKGKALLMWEGNNCTQDLVISHSLAGDDDRIVGSYKDLYSANNIFIGAIQVFFGVGPNDEARSMSIQGIKAGRIIEFYDNPDGIKNDDWVEIFVKQDISLSDSYKIYSFEHSYEDAYVKVVYHADNGLDGKISYIKSYTNN